MKDFSEKLDEVYDFWKQDECPPISKLDFLGDFVFDFTTYDSNASEVFAKKMIEVIDCILNNKTFEYQENDENYFNYLTMVNMPFLQDKLSWGTSVRGAWFEDYGDGKYEIDCGRIVVNKKELKDFIKSIIDWSKIK